LFSIRFSDVARGSFCEDSPFQHTALKSMNYNKSWEDASHGMKCIDLLYAFWKDLAD
jgi:hypothetical protein